MKLNKRIIFIVIIGVLLSILIIRPPHVIEYAHYYLGVKYHKQVGYKNLYNCICGALNQIHKDNENLPDKLSTVRNLENGFYYSFEDALDEFKSLKHQWSNDRWTQFKSDIRTLEEIIAVYYESDSPLDYWERILKDHGYNGSPLFTSFSYPFTHLFPLTPYTIYLLALIDIILIILTFIFLYKTFGIKGIILSSVFFATALNMLSFLTLAFFRFTWLFALSLSFYFLSRKKYIASAFTWSIVSILRIFPAIMAVFFIVSWLIRKSQQDDQCYGDISTFVTAKVVSVIAVFISSLGTIYALFHITPLKEFFHYYERLHTHQQQFFLINSIGLENLFEAFNINTVFVVAILASAFAIGLLWSYSKSNTDILQLGVLSILFVPLFVDLSHYYYLMLIFLIPLKDKFIRSISIFLILLNIAAIILNSTSVNSHLILEWNCNIYSLALSITPLIYTFRTWKKYGDCDIVNFTI